MKSISWIFTVPLLLIIAVFAVSNRDVVTFRMFPLPFEVMTPLFLIPLATFVLGFLWGGFMVWNADRRLRKGLKSEQKKCDELSREIEFLKTSTPVAHQAEEAPVPVADPAPQGKNQKRSARLSASPPRKKTGLFGGRKLRSA